MSSFKGKGLEMEDNNCNGKMAKEDDVEEESRHLPDEIIAQHILPCLPIKPLIQCKLLSKQWNLKINSDYIIFSDPFTPLHSLFIQSGNTFYLYSCTNHDNDDGVVDNVESNLVRLDVNFEADTTIDEIKLVGCSNGLVCLAENKGKYFYLYNPKTNQSHKFYPADSNFWHSCTPRPWVNWGFGYVSSDDDYKVVRIIPYRNREVAVVHVYSLRSNMWSKLESGLEEGDMTIGHAHLINETLYWSMCRGRTLAFDLARETFEFFPPFLVMLDRCSKRTLATFDDQLFIIESYVPTQSSPHPAAELPNEPPEGTWPVYQPEILPD